MTENNSFSWRLSDENQLLCLCYNPDTTSLPQSTKTIQFKSKSGLLVVAILVIAGGVVLYGKSHGFNFHVKSGAVTSTHVKATSYLDGQVIVSGTITSIPGPYLLQSDSAIIGYRYVYQTVNRTQPIEHYLTGSPTIGSTFRGLLVKEQSQGSEADSITHYKLSPFDPFYLLISPPELK